MNRHAFTALLTALMVVLSLTTTGAASPSVSPTSLSHESPTPAQIIQANRPGPHCAKILVGKKHNKAATLCAERVKVTAAPPHPTLERPSSPLATPIPPSFCYRGNGGVNYNRHDACEQSSIKVILTVSNPPHVEVGWIWQAVWEHLSAKNRHWQIQVGLIPYALGPELAAAELTGVVGAGCTNHACGTPDTKSKRLQSGIYAYYKFNLHSSTSSIKYHNPEAILEFDSPFSPPQVLISLNSPFDVRCDSERYIYNGVGGCVYYLGYHAILSYYLSYTGAYRAVAENSLYDEVVRDGIHHYGNIRYGYPLSRGLRSDVRDNRSVACPAAITAKASALGESCDEYPYASTRQGAAYNPLYSCAFVPLGQNRNQGTDLNVKLYQPDRILRPHGNPPQGDQFWVWITNAPARVPAVKQCSAY